MYKLIMTILFILFFIAGYLFTLTDLYSFYLIILLIVSISLIIVIIHAVNYKDARFYENEWILFLFILAVILMPVLFYIVGEDNWSKSLFIIAFYPVVSEELFFRYYLQQVVLGKANFLSSLTFQSFFYTLYYVRFVVADGGRAFPFPYNFLMMVSIFTMGSLYGILTHYSKNIYASLFLHYIIWSLFPFISVISPVIASSIVPS